MTSRRWTFTYFIPSEEEDDFKYAEQRLREHKDFRGLALQYERCGTTGRIHIQGYCEFNKPVRQRAFKLLLADHCHVEPARSSRETNIDYCTKEDTRVKGPWVDDVLREPVSQGRRNDLLDLGKRIMGQEITYNDLCHERPDMVIKFPRGLTELYTQSNIAYSTSLRPDIQVEVIFGPAGSGKTRFALRSLEQTFILDGSNSDTLWFDGYREQTIILIDDFYGWIRHGTLLRILDIYPYRCPIKGGHTYAAWRTVYITSNRHPSTWYTKIPWLEDQALQRRIKHIWEVQSTPFGTIWTCEKTNVKKTFDENYNELNDNILFDLIN